MKLLKIVSLSIAISLCFVFSGCGSYAENNPTNTNETYIMPEALDAAQYCSFINKEITACTNQLSTLMLLADQVAENEYKASDTKLSAEQSLGIIKDCYDKVDIMTPPAQYKDTRENVLRCMENATESVETLITLLSEYPLNTNTIKSHNSVLQGDFIALTAEFNVYYQ